MWVIRNKVDHVEFLDLPGSGLHYAPDYHASTIQGN